MMMIHARAIATSIDNFLLVKYRKTTLDAPSHVGQVPTVQEWQDHQEMMFETMVDQLNYFYPKATIHVLTNERHQNVSNLVYHYRPDIESNHTAKFLLYGLIDKPAMYLDTDIVLVRHFKQKHLATAHPFNLFQYSTRRSLQTLTRKRLEFDTDKQYNCGMIWIGRPSKEITKELQDIKRDYFDEKKFIESNKAWYPNDEHALSYFISKYGFKMRLFPEVNAFRYLIKYKDIFQMQSIHYTGVRNKSKFVNEYREICKNRVNVWQK